MCFTPPSWYSEKNGTEASSRKRHTHIYRVISVVFFQGFFREQALKAIQISVSIKPFKMPKDRKFLMQTCLIHSPSHYLKMLLSTRQFLCCSGPTSRRTSMTRSQCLPLTLLDMKLDDIRSGLLQILNPLV